jgi:hypothetical protein
MQQESRVILMEMPDLTLQEALAPLLSWDLWDLLALNLSPRLLFPLCGSYRYWMEGSPLGGSWR